MNQKTYIFFSIAIISLILLLGIYFYSLENITKFLDVWPPFEYVTHNVEKFENKEIYMCFEISKINENENYLIIKGIYHEIYPTNKKNLDVEFIAQKNLELKERKIYGFKVKILKGKFYILEKYNLFIQEGFIMQVLLFNVSVVFIMLYLLSKLKINFRKFLIE